MVARHSTILVVAIALTFPLLGLLSGDEPKVSSPASNDQKSSRKVGSPDKGAHDRFDRALLIDLPDKPESSASIDPDEQDKYKAALVEALNLRAQGKHVEALTSLESAKAVQDTEEIERQIDTQKELIANEAAAELALGDVQTVLNQGKAEEAAKLAADSLRQYGETSFVDKLTALKLQADAVVSGQAKDDPSRADLFRQEADAALKDKDFRAATIALGQAHAFAPDDADVKNQLQDVQDKVQRYDDARRQAAELRADVQRLEDALALYKQAREAWDTPKVQQEIDEMQLVLQNRRDRLGVADFEVRGDIGMEDAGKTIADEVLPVFKAKYDLVERGQIADIQKAINVEPGDIVESDEARSEFTKIARVRYLVVGSVSRAGGLIVVHGRLVDVETGLVVQTAKIAAATPDEVLHRAHRIAKILMMSDQEKMEYEEKKAKKQQEVKVAEDAPLPSPPEVPDEQQVAPPPIIPDNPRQPELGKIEENDFNLPPPPDADQVPAPVNIPIEQNEQMQQRSVQVMIEVGDNYFRRGRFREAFALYELASSFAPGNAQIQTRLDRCRPLLPPPDGAVIALTRPRVALLNFLVVGDPNVVPAPLSWWVPENLAPYFASRYEVVDPAELHWWMGRMGLSVRDVLRDPCARRWLARALNVRYFVFGEIRETASFVVQTHMVDAEFGFEVASGRLHVHNPSELRLRMGDLAGQTLMDSTSREQWLRDEDELANLLKDAREAADRREFDGALELLGKARRMRPRSAAVLALIASVTQTQRRFEFDRQRKADLDRRQKLAEAERDRRRDLMHRIELTRIKAEHESLGGDERRRFEQDRRRAADRLASQAEVAFKGGKFELSIQLLQGAIGLAPSDDYYQRIALARARINQLAAKRTDDEREAFRAAQRRQLDAARPIIDEAHKKRTTAEVDRVAVAAQRDQAEYDRLLAVAEAARGKHEFDNALGALQTARQLQSSGLLKRTKDVDALIADTRVELARADAGKQGKDALAKLERDLSAEKERRTKAEADAKLNHQLYDESLKRARKALAAKAYDNAITEFKKAGKVYSTDVVLTGLKEAEKAQKDEIAQHDADKTKQEEQKARIARVQSLVQDGKKLLDAKKFDDALKPLQDARHLDPQNVDVLALIAKGEQGRSDQAAADRRSQDHANFQALIDSGKSNMKAKQYQAAVLSFKEAVRLHPNDAEAKAALADAETARDKQGKEDDVSKKKAADYEKLMQAGRGALAAKQFDDALRSFNEAQKLLPGDKTSINFIAEAVKGRDQAAKALADEAKKRDDTVRNKGEMKKAVEAARTALADHDLDTAEKQLAVAAKLFSDDPELLRLQGDLKKARDTAQANADAVKKRDDRIAALLKAGRSALQAKKYDDAVHAFGEAKQLNPADKSVQDLFAQATKERDAAAASATDAQVRDLVGRARTAMKTKQFDDAGKLLVDAGRLSPRHPDVTKALGELADARKLSDAESHSAEVAARVKKLIASGRDSLKSGKLDAAEKDFKDASSLAPKDPEVLRALKDLSDTRALAEGDKKRKAYESALRSGRDALASKKYDDAIKDANEALKLFPGDKDATALLNSATKAKTDNADAAKKKADFDKLMTQAQNALASKKYDDAIKDANEALKLFPGDKDAAKIVNDATKAKNDAEDAKKKADFERLMAQGRAAMSNKKYDDAIKAFTDALKLYPNDKDAQKAKADAEKAKNGK